MKFESNPKTYPSFSAGAASSRGISLVEVMVSMVLGSLLILAVTQVFLSNNQTSRLDRELARTYDRALFAFNVLEQTARQIGHSSCIPPEMVGNWIPSNELLENLYNDSPVRGWENAGTEFNNAAVYALPGSLNLTNLTDAALPEEFTATMHEGSDLIILNHIRSQEVTITNVDGPGAVGANPSCSAGSPQAGNNILTSPITLNIVQGSVVFFEKNCQGGDIFRVGNANLDAGLIRAGPLGPGFCTEYNAGDVVTLSLIEPTLFFIGLSDDGEPSLFRHVINPFGIPAPSRFPELLIEGVETMQITYGLQSVAGMRQVTRYVDATGVADWDEVASVRIGLLLRSADGVLDTAASRTLNVNGTRVQTPSDKRARVVKTATIAIRNRT